LTGQSTSSSITPAGVGGALGMRGGVPPTKLFRGARPLKRWRYVGVFGEELMACAAIVQIGPARQSFWAVHLPGAGGMRERTRLLPRRGEVELVEGLRRGDGPADVPGRLRVRDRGVELD